MRPYFALPAAGFFYFFSAWLAMIFARILPDEIGIRPFGYGTALGAPIATWLVVAPAIGAVVGARRNMLLVLPIKKEKQQVIPAVTHVNATGRLQSVMRQGNELYYRLIEEFDRRTGVPVVLNTSFNLRASRSCTGPRRSSRISSIRAWTPSSWAGTSSRRIVLERACRRGVSPGELFMRPPARRPST